MTWFYSKEFKERLSLGSYVTAENKKKTISDGLGMATQLLPPIQKEARTEKIEQD